MDCFAINLSIKVLSPCKLFLLLQCLVSDLNCSMMHYVKCFVFFVTSLSPFSLTL